METVLIVAAIVVALWGAHRSGSAVADSMESMADPEHVQPPSMPGVGVALAILFVVAVLVFAFAGA